MSSLRSDSMAVHNAHGKPVLLEIGFRFADTMGLIMKNRGREHSIGLPLSQGLIQMLHGAGPAGRDDRNGDGF